MVFLSFFDVAENAEKFKFRVSCLIFSTRVFNFASLRELSRDEFRSFVETEETTPQTINLLLDFTRSINIPIRTAIFLKFLFRRKRKPSETRFRFRTRETERDERNMKRVRRGDELELEAEPTLICQAVCVCVCVSIHFQISSRNYPTSRQPLFRRPVCSPPYFNLSSF